MTSEKLPKGYICWSTDGLDLIESDVGKLKSDESSDESVIQAVHQHVDVIVKTNEVNASIASILEGGRKNRDTKVIDAFKASIENEDIASVLMSVVGETGSGKSHLVRWLYHAIESDNERYIKLWVPRRENAQKFLIKKLIDDLAKLGSARAVELRAKLDLTVKESKDSPQAVAASLYSRIIDELQYEPTLRESTSTEDVQFRKMFLGEVGDKNPRKFLWQLLNDVRNEEGEISDGLTSHLRLVVQSISELSNEDESETHPTLDDKRAKKILKSFEKIVKEKLQRDAYEYLFMDALSNLSLITELLNEAIELAVNTVLNVEGANIREVFSEVREELAKHGKMLLIFVEDFSAISGSNAGLGKLQRDLMGMFTEASDGNLAPIRVAMAVTKQTFNSLENNFQQRMHFILEIDNAFDDLEVEPFIASYLRLARTNRIELNEARKNATESELSQGDWVPNKCGPCKYREECFSVFEHENGVGLYPLTKHALVRISDNNRLTPRGRISRLKNVLMSIQGDLAREVMPSQAVESNFGPSIGTDEWNADQNEMLRIEFGLGDVNEGAAKSRLQRYVHNWTAGHMPSEVEFRVFDLPRFKGFADGTVPKPQIKEETKKGEGNPEPSSGQLQADLDRINRWLGGEANDDLGRIFTATLESTIRRSVVNEVTAAFGRQFTGATLEDYASQIGLRFVDASIRIEGVPTQGTGEPELLRPYFNIPRSEEGANVLRGVLYLEAMKNGEIVGSEVPLVRRPLLLVAVGEFIRELVERLTLIVHSYEKLDNSIIDVTAKLLCFTARVNKTLLQLTPQEIFSLWMSEKLEIDEPTGDLSEVSTNLFRSMSELRKSMFILSQVNQEEGTSKNIPHYWRTIHLVNAYMKIEMEIVDVLASINSDFNSDRNWFTPISESIRTVLQHLSDDNLTTLKSRLQTELLFVNESSDANLPDQINWLKTNIDPLLTQSAFQTSKDLLMMNMREISESFSVQGTQIKDLEKVLSGDFNGNAVLSNAAGIDEIFQLAEKHRYLVGQLHIAIKRVTTMSSGGASTVVQPVADFKKLTTLSGLTEIGNE
jgi:hypothetical protein